MPPIAVLVESFPVTSMSWCQDHKDVNIGWIYCSQLNRVWILSPRQILCHSQYFHQLTVTTKVITNMMSQSTDSKNASLRHHGNCQGPTSVFLAVCCIEDSFTIVKLIENSYLVVLAFSVFCFTVLYLFFIVFGKKFKWHVS